MPEPVDPQHLLLIGAGPGIGAGVVRRFGRAGFRRTLISRGETLDQLSGELLAGAVKPGTDFDPDTIAELFWTAHTDSKDAWQTEHRFTGG
jgi:NAD(P)-dependent dehydrogenase (short-subunit alcohol dehydrogenase family)